VSDRLREAAEELRRQLGDVRRRELGAVSPLAARRFALACGESDPVFFDDDAAAAAGWAGTPLPPLLLSSTRSWEPGPGRSELAGDGTPHDDVGFPAGYGLRALGGGQSLRFHEDAVAGVELASEVELTGATVKSGRSGDMIVVELERRFLGPDGELLVSCDETRILR
jgi:acyl dehydratase